MQPQAVTELLQKTLDQSNPSQDRKKERQAMDSKMFDLNLLAFADDGKENLDATSLFSSGTSSGGSTVDDGCGVLITRQLFPMDHDLDLKKRTQINWELEVQPVEGKRNRRGPRSRSSQYRGVTFYRRTGRWESHIWDCGKQVYLGGFDTAIAAARVYDKAAIKFRGLNADINFNARDYEEDMKQMKNMSKEEMVRILRRQSTGLSRWSSKYRGLMLHKCERWEARTGKFLGNKAYNKAAIKRNEREVVTKFVGSVHEGNAMDGDEWKDGVDLNLGISSQNMKEERVMTKLPSYNKTAALALSLSTIDVNCTWDASSLTM